MLAYELQCHIYTRMDEVIKLKHYITVDKNGSIDLSWLAQPPSLSPSHTDTHLLSISLAKGMFFKLFSLYNVMPQTRCIENQGNQGSQNMLT